MDSDRVMRPKGFDEYIGQERVKRELRAAIAASLAYGEPLDHILLEGSPGTGKTSLAEIVAAELGRPVMLSSGMALTSIEAAVQLLRTLPDDAVLFLDEIHRLDIQVQELFYTAMEGGYIDITVKRPAARRSTARKKAAWEMPEATWTSPWVGEGDDAPEEESDIDVGGIDTKRIALPAFTLIGATTLIDEVSKPMRDRFGLTMHLDRYSDEDMAKIVSGISGKVGLLLSDAACMAIGRRSRATPRLAKQLVKRLRIEYAANPEYNRATVVGASIVEAIMRELDVDPYGMGDRERRALTVMRNAGKPVSARVVAASLGMQEKTYILGYEAFLSNMGFVEATSRGRQITDVGLKALEEVAAWSAAK